MKIRLNNLLRSLALSGIATIVLVPGFANAAQITSRSATPGSSAPSASTSYSFKFTPGTATAVKSVRFQMCTSPLATTACTVPTGGTMASATAGAQSGGGITNQYTTTSYVGATDVLFANATGNTLTLTQITFPVNAVTNPSTANQSFYFRISTYSDAAGTVGVDTGAVAVSTTQSLTVAANVQESLVFCVGTNTATATSCGNVSGSTVSIGTGADNTLSASAPSGSTSEMFASTNAASGYSISYLAPTFSSSNDTIAAAGTTPTAFPAAGNAMFGMNLRANTSPSIANSSDVSGPGTGAVATNYNTVNQFAFVAGTATVVATASVPTQLNDFVSTYAAQAGNTTKPGAFSTTINYVATGNF